MHRFYLDPSECRDDNLALTGREAHHALHVLRLQRGDMVTVLDGAGHEYVCEVRQCERDQLHLAVTRKTFVPPPPCQITLLQAVPKGKIFEVIIQKATELGAARIVPLLSERVSLRIEDDGTQKAGKWQLVAIEAIKQCGSAWLPKVEPPVAPETFLKRGEKCDLPLIASLQPNARHAREYFQAFRDRHGRPPASVCLWIGPEGDFTPREVAAVETGGARPITLGPLVLRSETAAVSGLSIVAYEARS